MKLTKCSHGHFYDSDKYDVCPHCGDKGVENKSVEKKSTQGSNSKKIKTEDDSSMHKTFAYGANNEKQNMTQSYFELNRNNSGNSAINVEDKVMNSNKQYSPVCGWLVGISGNEYGHSFELFLMNNSVGSGANNIISIKNDNSLCVSNHAVIPFDSANQLFYLDFYQSEGKVLINNKMVTDSVYLNYMDVLQIGGSSYMLVPLCKDGFTWWPNTEIDYVGQPDNSLGSHSSAYGNQNITTYYNDSQYIPENQYYGNYEEEPETDVTGLLISSPWRCPTCNALNSSMFKKCRTCGEEK